jgi:hypothetical protein
MDNINTVTILRQIFEFPSEPQNDFRLVTGNTNIFNPPGAFTTPRLISSTKFRKHHLQSSNIEIEKDDSADEVED